MIKRIWHGWTEPQHADAYERLVDREIVPAIIDRAIPGLRSVDILRCAEVDGEVEFVTVMTFDDWAAVEAFAGPDTTGSVVPVDARQLLERFDHHSRHYELVASHINHAGYPTDQQPRTQPRRGGRERSEGQAVPADGAVR